MDINAIKAAVLAHKEKSGGGTHSWKFSFKDGRQGTASVHVEHRDGNSFCVCSVGDRPTMVFKAAEVGAAIEQVLTTFKEPDRIQDELKGLWAAVNFGAERVWFNTTSRGGKANSFCIPLDGIVHVAKLLNEAQ